MQRAFPRGWRKDFSSLHKLTVTCACKESRFGAWSDHTLLGQIRAAVLKC